MQYHLTDHLGNLAVLFSDANGDGHISAETEATQNGDEPEILQRMYYYPFGMPMSGNWTHTQAHADHYTYNHKELLTSVNWYDYSARYYDAKIGRFAAVDPLAEEYYSWSGYNYVMDSPLLLVDPDGRAGEDFVLRQDGSIYWDKNANSQATTQAGETYLGKDLTFTFNSYIDANLWDGPGGGAPAGDKLTSTIKLTGSKNSAGELTGISATKSIKVGSTPLGTARDYFPGLGDDQNKFTFSQTKNSDGTLASYTLNFEQHASVSPIEEFGLNLMGYDIVNVAQKATFSLSGNQLSVTGATDVFPSATLTGNGTQLFKYNQPSFTGTHGINKTQVGVRIPRNPMNDGFIPVYDYKHLRPAPSFYKR